MDFKHLPRNEQIMLMKKFDKMPREEMIENLKKLIPVIQRVRRKAEEQDYSRFPDNVIPFPGKNKSLNFFNS